MTAAATDMRVPLDAVWDCLLPGVDNAGSPDDDQVLAERMRRLSLPVRPAIPVPDGPPWRSLMHRPGYRLCRVEPRS